MKGNSCRATFLFMSNEMMEIVLEFGSSVVSLQLVKLGTCSL